MSPPKAYERCYKRFCHPQAQEALSLVGGSLSGWRHSTEGLWSCAPTADWEGLFGAGQEDGYQLQLAPSLEGRPGGPAYQLSNSWVPCACPQAEARLPQVGGGAYL